ncbi:MAG TPA: hypothetical protein VMV69_11810 [Pirellulales bacterium]|nr:hypothetical protein [Pirellulales bacterium]
MNAAEALFEAVRVPRQVVIDHQVGALKVDALTGRVGRDQHPDIRFRAEDDLHPPAFVAVRAAVNGDDGVVIAKDAGDLVAQVVQRVAMFGKNDQFPLPAGGIAHFGGVLQNVGKFVPLAILAGGDHGLGFVLQPFQDDDFGFQFVDRAGRRRIVKQGFFEVLPLFRAEVVVILRQVRACA